MDKLAEIIAHKRQEIAARARPVHERDIARFGEIKRPGPTFAQALDQPDRLGVIAEIKRRFADQKLDTQDGIRIDWPDGWVHARASNTEPIMRIIAEARDRATADRLIAQVKEIVDQTAHADH